MKWLIFILILLVNVSCSHDDKQVIQLPIDLDVVAAKADLVLEAEMSKQVKYVAIFYSEHARNYDLIPLSKYVERHPEIGFIFYVDHESKDQLIQFMKMHQINIAVYYDPEHQFMEENNISNRNMTFIGYILNAQNEVLEMTNPSLPGFEELLVNTVSK